MTTQAWTFSPDHTSDVGFRAWGADVSAKLQAVGLIKTGDTGQIDWGTASRPSGSSDAGYEIYQFNDALVGSDPLYMRVNYGSNATSRPRITIQIGTETDGAGALSGPGASSTRLVTSGSTAAQVDGSVALNNYMVHADGFFGFVWGADLLRSSGVDGALGFCAVARTVDENEDVTADGVLLLVNNGLTTANGTLSLTAQYSYLAGTSTSSTSVRAALRPASGTGTQVGDDLQAFNFFHWTPRMQPCAYLCAVDVTEHADFSTFQANLIGAGDRVFLNTGRQGGEFVHGGSAPLPGVAMLWE